LEENYHPDVAACLRLPRGRGFTRGQIFTVRRRGKNRVRADEKIKIKNKKIKTRASRAKPREEEGFFGLVPLVTHPSSIPLLGGLTPKFLSLSLHSL
jgi:hypothetical protein